jgi:hypothetical protein
VVTRVVQGPGESALAVKAEDGGGQPLTRSMLKEEEE